MTGPVGITNTNLPAGGPVTAERIRDLVAHVPRPRREVIITPSIEALEAVFGVTARGEATPLDVLTGIPVVVTQLATRPRLLPAEVWERMKATRAGVE
jgi:hypothetical protein